MNLDEAYQILQVSTNINKEDLKVKYKRLVLLNHPDRNKEAGATEKFIQIKDAYEIILKHLENPIQRIYPGQIIYANDSGATTFTTAGWTFTFGSS